MFKPADAAALPAVLGILPDLEASILPSLVVAVVEGIAAVEAAAFAPPWVNFCIIDVAAYEDPKLVIIEWFLVVGLETVFQFYYKVLATSGLLFLGIKKLQIALKYYWQ